jgi:hypothetical protein
MAARACVALPADILLQGRRSLPDLRLQVFDVCAGGRGGGRDPAVCSVAGATLQGFIRHTGCEAGAVVARVRQVADALRARAARVRGADGVQLLAGLGTHRVAVWDRGHLLPCERGERVAGKTSAHGQTVLSPLLMLLVLLSLASCEERDVFGRAEAPVVGVCMARAVSGLAQVHVDPHQAHARDVERRALARAIARMDLTLARKVSAPARRVELDVEAALCGHYPEARVDASTQYELMLRMWHASTERTGGV